MLWTCSAGRRSSAGQRSNRHRRCAPASASAEIISAFQLVRRLSSSPGLVRWARACSSRSRIRCTRRLVGARAAILEHVQAGPGVVRIYEIALLGGAKPADRRVRVLAKDLFELGGRPYVEASLDAVGVRVERAVEASLRASHLAQCPFQCVVAHLQQGRVSRQLKAVQVGACQQCVVVEHLLEVRHRPGLIDRVAVKAAADLVVDAAAGHAAQGVQRHLALSPRHQELKDRGLRELRRSAEAAVHRVEGRSQPLHGVIERTLLEGLLGRPQQGAAGKPLAQLLAACPDLLSALAPRLGHRQQHLREGRHPWAILRREICAAVERQTLRGQEHIQRPAAVAGHALHRLHVQRVHVGALLAIDLHAHEALVHQLGGALVLEGLTLHHVTPVAGGVADRDEQRHVALSRQLQCAPGPTAASPPGSSRAGAGRESSRPPVRWASLSA